MVRNILDKYDINDDGEQSKMPRSTSSVISHSGWIALKGLSRP